MISKRLPLIFLFGAIVSTSAFGRDDSLLARITVYWARGAAGTDRYTRQHKSSTGLRLQQGHCAVDPKKIPYGSQVVLPDGTSLSAVDTGSAVRNRKAARRLGRTNYERNAIVIDKFFETKRQALAWANSNPPFLNVKVVPPNAPAVAKLNITNSQPIALSPPVPATTPVPTTTTVASVGSAVRNPLGRLGR
jgi:3D (Asp-Asp-Asp) domain-containing protein